MALLLAINVSATTYTNKATGNWSASGSWMAGAPPVGGASDAVIQFSPTGGINSTNDLAGAFWLNQLVLVPNQAATLYAPGGNSLLFTNSTVVGLSAHYQCRHQRAHHQFSHHSGHQPGGRHGASNNLTG